MDWTDLKAYVGASTSDDTYVEECWNTAKELVASYIKTTKIPAARDPLVGVYPILNRYMVRFA